jgi:hypothetical protein
MTTAVRGTTSRLSWRAWCLSLPKLNIVNGIDSDLKGPTDWQTTKGYSLGFGFADLFVVGNKLSLRCFDLATIELRRNQERALSDK